MSAFCGCGFSLALVGQGLGGDGFTFHQQVGGAAHQHLAGLAALDLGVPRLDGEDEVVARGRWIGAPTARVLIFHVLPNVMPTVIVLFTMRVGAVILVEAGLSFLGLGIPPPAPSWGGMLTGSGRTFMYLAPWLALAPGLCITIVVYAINVFLTFTLTMAGMLRFWWQKAGEPRRRRCLALFAAGLAAPAPALERRAKVQRRRQIDPTTCERDYSIEEVEFMNAMDEYKRKNGRMFPTCSEVLEVIRGLGYVRLSPAGRAMLAAEGEVMGEGAVADFPSAETAGRSPLARALFAIPDVSRVFFGSDFISVTKRDGDWKHLKPAILGAVMEHFTRGLPLLSTGWAHRHPLLERVQGLRLHRRPALTMRASYQPPAAPMRTSPRTPTAIRPKSSPSPRSSRARPCSRWRLAPATSPSCCRAPSARPAR